MGCICGKNEQNQEFVRSVTDRSVETMLRSATPAPRSELNKLRTIIFTPSIMVHSDDKQRKNILQELVHTEKTYIRGLQKIYSIFLDPLWEARRIQKSVYDRFGSIDMLLKFHQRFWENMNKELTKLDKNESDLMAQILKDFDDLGLYFAFVTQYETILQTIATMRKDSSINKHFINCDKKKGYDINAYLVLPIQRVTRYKLLFTQLLKSTPEEYVTHGDLKAILGKVEQAVEHTNEVKRNHENFMCILQMSAKIKNLDCSLYQEDRILIFESGCQFVGEDSEKLESGYLIVFNDLLVTCTSDWEKRSMVEMDNVESANIEDVYLKLRFSEDTDRQKRVIEDMTMVAPMTFTPVASSRMKQSTSLECTVGDTIMAKDEEQAKQWMDMIKNHTFYKQDEGSHVSVLAQIRTRAPTILTPMALSFPMHDANLLLDDSEESSDTIDDDDMFQMAHEV